MPNDVIFMANLVSKMIHFIAFSENKEIYVLEDRLRIIKTLRFVFRYSVKKSVLIGENRSSSGKIGPRRGK